jgi:hypothetical protein
MDLLSFLFAASILLAAVVFVVCMPRAAATTIAAIAADACMVVATSMAYVRNSAADAKTSQKDHEAEKQNTKQL